MKMNRKSFLDKYDIALEEYYIDHCCPKQSDYDLILRLPHFLNKYIGIRWVYTIYFIVLVGIDVLLWALVSPMAVWFFSTIIILNSLITGRMYKKAYKIAIDNYANEEVFNKTVDQFCKENEIELTD